MAVVQCFLPNVAFHKVANQCCWTVGLVCISQSCMQSLTCFMKDLRVENVRIFPLKPKQRNHGQELA